MKNKDLHRRRIDSSLSAKIVIRLLKEGMTLPDIGKAMGLSRSYISLVKNRRRGFTMDRLKRLEKTLNRPLPLLFLQVIEEESVPKELKAQYRTLRQILKQGARERQLSWGI